MSLMPEEPMSQPHTSPLSYDRPRRARGFLPLVLGAIGVGRAIVGAVQGNQTKQRNKGYINANYRLAKQRLSTNQALVRQNTAEALNARGLSPVVSAMRSGGTPHTLGEQVQADTEQQLGLERQDLENQHDRALKENNASYINTLIASGVSGINSAVSAYTAGQDVNALRAGSAAANTAAADNIAKMPVPGMELTPTGGSSSILDAMRSGVAEPAHLGLGGVDVVNPLGHPDSAWNPNRRTFNGSPNLANSDFNVGNA